ncbi:uncharacterized protein LOC141913052 [Tubulanus polymorphus]|uniref:uncharacterized protein LOC141913052 n=1 Tax=Tubulanus polymorphus TaxID=672921 RepID=UPI003DA299BE
MSVIQRLFTCVSDHREQGPPTKVRFGVPLCDSFREGAMPMPLKELLVIIARDGMSTNDLFRRPGNPTDMKKIMKKMEEGKPIIWTEYNFYTLANVVKKFLLRIPGGIFGRDVEDELLSTLDITDSTEQLETISNILVNLPSSVQNLAALLFGTWFRMIHHSEYNTMRVEAVAKSVAGSIFHSCTEDPSKVNRAAKLMEIMIENFGVTNMFGPKNVQYFATSTNTAIRSLEKFCYEYTYPPSDVVPPISEEEFHESRRRSNTFDETSSIASRKPSTKKEHQPLQRLLSNKSQNNSMSAPEVSKILRELHLLHLYRMQMSSDEPISPGMEEMQEGMFNSISLGRFELVRQRQLALLERRSNWFLSTEQTQEPHIDLWLQRTLMRQKQSHGSLGSSGLATSSDLEPHSSERLDTGGDMFALHKFRKSPATDPTRRQHRIIENMETEEDDDDDENDKGNDEGNVVRRQSDVIHEEERESELSEKEVRYFMIENWYNGNNQDRDDDDEGEGEEKEVKEEKESVDK